MTQNRDRSPLSSDGPGEDAAFLLQECIDRLNAGERLDLAGLLREHPHVGPEVIDQLKEFEGIEDTLQVTTPLGTLGDYTLRRQIGRGGMGVVYEAWENSMDRAVALKVLPGAIAADDKAYMRFMREARTAGKLSHANVVGVYGMGVKEQTPYYAMEYVEGETLAQIIAKLKDTDDETETPFGKKSEQQFYLNLAKSFADVADGLQHAHSKSVIHRDIKPSNLMLDGEGRLRILDFGLARLEGQESLTLSGDLMGTVLYMSPEQAMAKRIPLDHRTDVYSLGATMYEVLTGQPPFRGKDQHDTMNQIVVRDPRSPRQLNPRVPLDLETVALKCLRKDADDRYRTAEALAQDLQRFVRGNPVEARPEARREKVQRWIARNRVPMITAAVLLAIAFVGLACAVFAVTAAYETASAQREERRRELYVSDMRLAGNDWLTGNVGRVDVLLDRHAPKDEVADLRGWEWHYLDALRRSRPAPIAFDPSGVAEVAWSPDGSRIASRSSAGKVQVVQVEGARNELRLRENEPLLAMAWSPDGERLATVGESWSLCLWNGAALVSDQPVDPVDSELDNRAIVWSPDGRYIAATSSPTRIDLRDGTGGEVLRTLSAEGTQTVSCLAWSADGTRLAACLRMPPQVLIWDTSDWVEQPRLETSGEFLYSLAWSPDSTRFLTCGNTRELSLWDMSRLEEPERLLQTGIVATSGSWSSDSGWIAAGCRDGTIRVWRTSGRNQEADFVLRGHRHRVRSVAWSPDSTRIVSGGQDGNVLLWDPRRPVGCDLPLEDETGPAWSPDGACLATYSHAAKSILVRRSDTWGVVASFPCRGTAAVIAFSPDGDVMAIASGGRFASEPRSGVQDDFLELLDWRRKGASIARVEGVHGGPSQCVRWSPQGDRLASGGFDGALRIWNGSSLTLLHEFPHPGGALGALAWSPDGARIAATRRNLSVVVRDTSTWSVVLRAQRGEPANKRATVSTRPEALAWSPDGTRLVAAAPIVASTRPAGLFLWDVATGRELFSGLGHVSGTNGVAWHPNGSRLATVGTDGTLKIRDATTFEELITLPTRGDAIRVLWHPLGEMLVVGGNHVNVLLGEEPREASVR